jgi:hypothetical protein
MSRLRVIVWLVFISLRLSIRILSIGLTVRLPPCFSLLQLRPNPARAPEQRSAGAEHSGDDAAPRI